MSLHDQGHGSFGRAAMGAFSLPGPRRPAAPRKAEAVELAHAAFAGIDVVLDPTGALYWPAERTLVVSDLHLETGSSYARTGQMLPPYDTGVTLSRLFAAVARHAPARLIALGDTFHDPFGAERLPGPERAALRNLCAATEVIFVEGNHDHASAAALGGIAVPELALSGVTFRHIPAPDLGEGREVAGHLHPAARILIRGKAVKRRCFVGCDRRLVMPAFGCLTGGLPVCDPAFVALWPDGMAPRLHLLGRGRLYAL